MVSPHASNPALRAAAAAPFARVKQHLKEGLAAGRWTPGALMPSERELVALFRVSRMTVTRAVRELHSEGLVERLQGVGTFAAKRHHVASTLTIRDLHGEIAERGHQHHTEIHLRRAEKASRELAARLGLRPGGRVFHTLIVHFENGVPLQCEDRYVNPACAPEYLSVDFTAVTPTNYLLDVAPFWEAQYSIEASQPTAREAGLLAISKNDPCLIINRRTFNRSGPITIGRLVHPGSRYLLQGELSL